MAVPKTLEIQRLEKTTYYTGWKALQLSKIKHHEDSLIISPPFRILVDNILIYSTREENLNDIGLKQDPIKPTP